MEVPQGRIEQYTNGHLLCSEVDLIPLPLALNHKPYTLNSQP